MRNLGLVDRGLEVYLSNKRRAPPDYDAKPEKENVNLRANVSHVAIANNAQSRQRQQSRCALQAQKQALAAGRTQRTVAAAKGGEG